MRVAVFRPADERMDRAEELLREEGHDVLRDPLLEPRSTGRTPLEADYMVFTSLTGVVISVDAEVDFGDTVVCAIGPRTRDALEERGVEVGVLPDEYTSEGLVEALRGEVRGRRVEVARSDHGSQELLVGLNDADAFVHETVLYELMRPEGAGERTVEALADGSLDAVLFTSSLTVEHLLDAAGEAGLEDQVLEALRDVAVGAIGEPTRRTAEMFGVSVNFLPEQQTFESLVRGLEDYREE